MKVHLMLLTAWAITGIDANTTLANTIVTEHHTSHVSHAAGTDADTTLTKTIVTEHHTSHVSHAAGTDADTTLTKTIVTEHHTSHVSHADGIDADTTSTKTIVTEHHTSHGIEAGKETNLPMGGHKETSEAHVAIDAHTPGVKHVSIKPLTGHVFDTTAIDNALPPEDPKKDTSEPHDGIDADTTSTKTIVTEHHTSHGIEAVVTDSLSKPTMKYIPLGKNEMHITCFSKSRVLPIRYQLFLHERILQEKIVYKSEPANFTMRMTPGTKVYLICTAISPSGEKSSNEVTLRVDDSAVPEKDSEPDQKDHDSGHEHLISPQYILTSVTREAREWNNLVLITCGPLLLLILVIVIAVSYLRSQKEQLIQV
ncbi:uncharacterized protein LOC122940015 isoform X2 [Bufo gargarizans]|uniref:uncharacterized protein LOC122940015 isoform X2 n=1 Tax=Bufo gargarizans TaxID=30331 RepID=UPI001CF2E453|nr:uncharacterized protein LOC122940015 isoform X2 [Bufo gargarizans]